MTCSRSPLRELAESQPPLPRYVVLALVHRGKPMWIVQCLMGSAMDNTPIDDDVYAASDAAGALRARGVEARAFELVPVGP